MIPIEVDGDFKTDASGNGGDKRRIEGGHWCAVYASCQCPGSGQWVAGKLGKAQYFQQGANVIMGPIILKPGENAQVRVVGATAGAQASIVYWGWQGDAIDGSDLAAVVPSIESAGSLAGSVTLSLTGNSVISTQTNLLTAPASASTSGTVIVPAGTQSLSAVVVSQGGSGFLRLTGATSGLLVGVVVVGGVNNQNRDVFGVDSAVDTVVNWRLDLIGGTASAYINALPTPPPPPTPLTTFPIHVNGTVTAAAPYTLWTLTHDAVNPLAFQILGWELAFDGASGGPFAALDVTSAAIDSGPGSNGPELWNMSLATAVRSAIDWDPPIVVAATNPLLNDASLQLQAPIGGSSYNAHGTINLAVVPWVPGLGAPLA